jgi:hypothetical protein
MRQEMARQGQAMMMEQAKMASARTMPSPMDIGLLVSNSVMDYTREDLMKIAVDIKREIKGAESAFKFVYGKIQGW